MRSVREHEEALRLSIQKQEDEMARTLGYVDEDPEELKYDNILIESASSSRRQDNRTEDFIEAMEKGFMVDGMDIKADEVSEALRASGIIRVNRMRRKDSTRTAD
jgi:hypothetical protein